MAEAESSSGQHQVLYPPSMTSWEKVGFLFFPALIALTAGADLLLSAGLLIALLVVLLLHPHTTGIVSSLIFTCGACLVFGALLIYPVHFFRKMRLRKKERGGFFPSGEELLVLRYRSHNSPVWKKVIIVSFFWLIASGVAWRLWTSPYRGAPANWSIPALFTLIAIVVTVDSVMPRPDRQWTGFTASGSFGVLSILFVIAVVQKSDHKISNWFLPLLMAALSIGSAVAALRDGREVREMKGDVESSAGL